MELALYFSRESLPSNKKWDKEFPMEKQICIIPHKRDFLLTFNELTPTPLEKIESVDMMRVLEHSFKVKMVATTNCDSFWPESARPLYPSIHEIRIV